MLQSRGKYAPPFFVFGSKKYFGVSLQNILEQDNEMTGRIKWVLGRILLKLEPIDD